MAFKVLVAARGVLIPDQRLNLGPLHWEHEVLATGPPGKSHEFSFRDRKLKESLLAVSDVLMRLGGLRGGYPWL